MSVERDLDNAEALGMPLGEYLAAAGGDDMNFGGHDRAWVYPALFVLVGTIIALAATGAGFAAVAAYQHFVG